MRLIGVRPQDMAFELQDISGYALTSDLKKLKKHISDFQPKTQEFIISLSTVIHENNLLIGDINSIEHWGKTSDGHVVLLDYGYSKNVYNSHVMYNQGVLLPDDYGATTQPTKKKQTNTVTLPKDFIHAYDAAETEYNERVPGSWPHLSKNKYFVSENNKDVICFLPDGDVVKFIKYENGSWKHKILDDATAAIYRDLPQKIAKL